ncbi:MAG: hypothetical protein AAFZ87_05555 [Planctomycetota bacterium]
MEDVQAVAVPVLGHRVVLSFSAEAEGLVAKDVIERLVNETAAG